MRRAAEWVCDTQPGVAVYLFVMEANANARAFYERLGAQNAETMMHVRSRRRQCAQLPLRMARPAACCRA